MPRSHRHTHTLNAKLCPPIARIVIQPETHQEGAIQVLLPPRLTCGQEDKSTHLQRMEACCRSSPLAL